MAIVINWVVLACSSQKSNENKVRIDENLTFYILALDDNWTNDAYKTGILFSDTLRLKEYISKNLSINQSTKKVAIQRGHFLENYLYEHYKLKNMQGFSPKKSLSKEEIELLKEQKALGYILPHKGVSNYEGFLLTELDTNPLIFIGESVTSLLKYKLKGIKDLENLADFLEKTDRFQFVVVIDKDLYLSLREEVLIKTDMSFSYKPSSK